MGDNSRVAHFSPLKLAEHRFALLLFDKQLLLLTTASLCKITSCLPSGCVASGSQTADWWAAVNVHIHRTAAGGRAGGEGARPRRRALMGMVVGLAMSTSTVATSPATHSSGPSPPAASPRAANAEKMKGPLASAAGFRVRV